MVSYLDLVTEMAPMIPESMRNGAATPAARGMCWPVLVTNPCRLALQLAPKFGRTGLVRLARGVGP